MNNVGFKFIVESVITFTHYKRHRLTAYATKRHRTLKVYATNVNLFSDFTITCLLVERSGPKKPLLNQILHFMPCELLEKSFRVQS